jgi:hypothetical protein
MSYEDSLKTGDANGLLSWRFSEINGIADEAYPVDSG